MLKIIPYTALRTLESVVRLHGFGRAAEELNVTQSAVSQHIKLIEDWTGHKLLNRGARGTNATPEGLRLAIAVAEGFGVVENICNELRDKRRGQSQTIVVSSLPGFAFTWLLPRLLNFDLKYPDLSVSLSTNVHTNNFANGDVDVMIHYGIGGFPGLHAELLMNENISPVCAPELLKENMKLDTVDDLSKFTLLVDEVAQVGNPPTWDFWAKEAGFTLPLIPRQRRFAQANMVVQAAIKGYGIAMGRSPLVIDALKSKTLIRPFKEAVNSQFSYWFVCPHGALKSKNVHAFRDWLHEEVAVQPSMETW